MEELTPAPAGLKFTLLEFDSVFNSYVLKSNGYYKKFRKWNAANKQADILIKRALKKQKGVSLKILGYKKEDNIAHTIRSCNLTKNYPASRDGSTTSQSIFLDLKWNI